MLRLLVAVAAVAAIVWSWGQLSGTALQCHATAYPVRCSGTVIGNRCHGSLGEAMPRRTFTVDAQAQGVVEEGARGREGHPHCRVTDCNGWECVDEIFVRTWREGEFREELRPGLSPVDPIRGPSIAYV